MKQLKYWSWGWGGESYEEINGYFSDWLSLALPFILVWGGVGLTERFILGLKYIFKCVFLTSFKK